MLHNGNNRSYSKLHLMVRSRTTSTLAQCPHLPSLTVAVPLKCAVMCSPTVLSCHRTMPLAFLFWASLPARTLVRTHAICHYRCQCRHLSWAHYLCRAKSASFLISLLGAFWSPFDKRLSITSFFFPLASRKPFEHSFASLIIL